MKLLGWAALAALSLSAGQALAAPGLGSEVYGARVEKGVTEVEARYGELTHGPDDGEAALVIEGKHGFTDRFAGMAEVEFEHEPGEGNEAESISLEGIYYIGQLPGGVDVGVQGEYEANLHGEGDTAALSGLFQKTAGPFDGRLNLGWERGLGRDNDESEFGYKAAAMWEVADELKLGAKAFGDLGDGDHFGGRREHFAGPVVEWEMDEIPGGELGLEAGYLFALGSARDEADGQLRLGVEWETKF
ncbi:MAG: hypothetical protein ACM3YN_09855 [Parcubacteria group bacterium]